MIILGTNSIKETGFDVDNSLRFHSDTYLTATFGSAPTLATKNTISLWFKRSTLGTLQQLYAANSNAANIVINTNDTIAFYTNSGQLLGPRVYRDTSSWMHFVFAFDSTQGTAANRFKVYINGIEETSFNNTAYPAQDEASQLGANGTTIEIGTRSNHDRIFEGYQAETAFVDGQALDATSFGEFDEDSGIWKPIDVSGLTFGNNGFYLEYKQSGTGTNSSGIGADTSGNDFHFAVTNFAATDQSTDTCTNNFATINPLDNYYAQATLSEGNTKVATNASAEAMSTSTFAMTKGKWYFEVDFISNSGSVSRQCGITPTPSYQSSSFGKSGDVTPHTHAYSDSGNVQTGNGSGGQTALASLSSFTNGDIIGIYMDLDNMKSYWSKNGSLMNSGTGLDLTALASNGTGHYMFYVGDNNGAAQTCEANFGNGFQSLSSAVTDDNGYGAFEYSPNITGDGVAKKFYSCCTKNLAEYG